MRLNKAGYSFYALAIIGLIISGYLYLRLLILLDTSVSGGIDFCSELFTLGCDEALKSEFGNFIGLPLSGWGIVYYVTILIISLLGELLTETFKETAIDLLLFVTGITAVISLGFITAFILNLIPFCPLCLLIHIINLTLILAVIKLSSKRIRESLLSLYTGLKNFIVTKGPMPRRTREQIVPLLLIIAAALLFYQWVSIQLISLEVAEDYSFDEFEFYEDFAAEKFVDLKLSPDDPVIGYPDAPVHMVIFSDFQCSGCRSVSDGIKTMLNRFKTELKITFKHYPLSSDCNSTLSYDLHPYSCQAAYAAEAAHMQGKFWEYHDLLFSTSFYGEEDELIDFALELELDITKFREDMKTAAPEKIAEDISLGNEITITGTPTIFINGKRINRPSLRALTWLIEELYRSNKFLNSR
jgi:protein-disulfide isomerase/uncharacterized membrane protein